MAPGTNRRLALVFALALAAPLVGPLVGAVAAGTGTQVVTNETLTASPGTYQELDGYELNRSSTTVVHNGTTLSAPEEYNLDADRGRLRLNASAVDSGDTVRVSYEYQASGPIVGRLLGLLPIMVGALFVVLAAKGSEVR